MRGSSYLRVAFAALLYVLAVVPGLPAAAQNAGDERRVALVVGNFSYDHVPRLANPGNDARLIATTLRQLGFTLVGSGVQENLDKAHFDRLVQDFGRTIQGADVALFYYAGHGMQVEGSNWLVPVDANPTRPQDLEFQMVNADLVLKQMDGAGTRLNLVVLDACRNNPFAALGTRAVAGGLAQMRAPEGTMISFATQPGNVAADGSGGNGPYATALAAAMHQPGLDIFQVFNHVGLTVKRATNGAQLPWESSSPIDGEFYFAQSDQASSDTVSGDTVSSDAAPEALAAPAVDAAGAIPIDQQGRARAAAATPSPGGASVAASSAAKPVPAVADAAAPPGPAGPGNMAKATAPATAVAPAGATTPAGALPPASSLQILAEQGKADAQFDLGFAYAKGEGVARDDAMARHWFALAAAQGVPRAQYWMGVMLERGRGGPRSYADALEWYRRAAERGFSPAEVAMGRFYGRGLGVARDPLQRTAWYRRAAEHDNPAGEWAIGNFYQFGDAVEKDVAQARQWYLRAAGHGFVPAEIRLGLMAEHGNGVAKDNADAVRWFREAADTGNAEALNDLATFYRRGLGVPKDYAEAMRLYRQAADKGNTMAEYHIGLMYADGLGVKQDRAQARVWFEQAAAAGNESAIDRLARIDAACGTPHGAPALDGHEARPPAGKC